MLAVQGFGKIIHVTWDIEKQDWTVFSIDVLERIMKMNEAIFFFTFIPALLAFQASLNA